MAEPDDSGIYELVDDDAPPERPAISPSPRMTTSASSTQRGPTLPCPDCGYELRGSRMDRCPECGRVITPSTIRRIEGKQDHGSTFWWVYRESLVAMGIGLGLVAFSAIYTSGIAGLAVMLLYLGITVAIGWVVYIACGLLWIGFDQPLHTLAVQLCGAYSIATGVNMILSLVIPDGLGLVTFLVTVLTLVGMLQKLLNLDLQDAVYVALITWFVRTVLFIALVALLA